MTYHELIGQGAGEKELRQHLVGGNLEATTVRIPKNLKDAIAEEAVLKGISFSAQLRMCVIEALVQGAQK